MSVTEINDEGSLAAWLSDKPDEWAQAVALRAALRALPHISHSSSFWLMDFALLPFRALVTSWMQLTDPEIFERSEESRANAAFGSAKFDHAEYKSKPVAANAADASYHSADAQSKSMWVKSDCVKAVGKAAEAIRLAGVNDGPLDNSGDEAESVFWYSVRDDCKRLLDYAGPGQFIRLAISRMWPVIPSDWRLSWQTLKLKLTAINLNFSALIEWYERRIQGEQAAFNIPGDEGRVEDKAILLRLARATDEDFWDHGYEHVNEKLKGWLDEARARVAPPLHEIVAEITVPPQNRNAISFRQDEDGRIAIDTSAGAEQLRTDADARDRHAEAVAEAKALLNRCKGNNAAARLTLRLENYLAAGGSAIEEIKPSLLVQRGEKLRQELAAYASPDTLLDPIADDILVDLKGWQSAHNMMVGLDPTLMAMDTAMLGPDRKPSLIPPDEIRQFVREAQAADILAEGTEEALIEAADLSPAIPDPADRRTIWSGEAFRNLALEAFAIALNHPKTTGTVIAFGAVLSSNLIAGVVGGVSILSSIKAAEYLVTHRQWIEDRMGNTPTWQALFAKVADWLEKVTPFRPN